MKKSGILPVICLILSLLLTGCGNSGDNGRDVPETTASQESSDTVEATAADEPSAEDPSDKSTGELALPTMEWWELYNPNGFDTLTAVIVNLNDISIDVSYDIVFYKEEAEVSRIEYCSNFGILPGHRDILWANYDVPADTDADDIRMENVVVSEACNPPIDGSYEYVGISDGEALFDFTFDSQPTLASITFLLYNDDNRNGQYDKGEIVVTDTASLTEQTGRVSFDAESYSYTDCEVFFTAY